MDRKNDLEHFCSLVSFAYNKNRNILLLGEHHYDSKCVTGFSDEFFDLLVNNFNVHTEEVFARPPPDQKDFWDHFYKSENDSQREIFAPVEERFGPMTGDSESVLYQVGVLCKEQSIPYTVIDGRTQLYLDCIREFKRHEPSFADAKFPLYSSADYAFEERFEVVDGKVSDKTARMIIDAFFNVAKLYAWLIANSDKLDVVTRIWRVLGDSSWTLFRKMGDSLNIAEPFLIRSTMGIVHFSSNNGNMWWPLHKGILHDMVKKDKTLLENIRKLMLEIVFTFYITQPLEGVFVENVYDKFHNNRDLSKPILYVCGYIHLERIVEILQNEKDYFEINYFGSSETGARFLKVLKNFTGVELTENRLFVPALKHSKSMRSKKNKSKNSSRPFYSQDI